jgi:deoxyribonuclease-4
MDEEEAREVGRVAREAMVDLHVHAPYYTNLAGDERNLEMAMTKIVAAGQLAEAMGAKTLAVHCGLYHEDGPEKTTELVIKNVKEIQRIFTEKGVHTKIALEVAGKQALFGTLDEILDVCRAVPGVIPILDFAHIHARSNGALLAQDAFEEVFDKCKDLGLDTYLIHFTGILYENGNERHHLPIKKGDLRFEPLVETILDHDYDVTIISHSPILEHDAMYMKIVLDRVNERRDLKAQREEAQRTADIEKERKRKEQEAADRKAEAEKKKAEAARLKAAAAKQKAKKKAAKAKAPKAKAKKKASKQGAGKPAAKNKGKKAAAKKATKSSPKKPRKASSSKPKPKKTAPKKKAAASKSTKKAPKAKPTRKTPAKAKTKAQTKATKKRK